MKKNFILLFSLTVICLLFTACNGNNTNNTCSHSYGNWTTVIESTCISEGKQERYCNYCNNKEE